MGQPVLKNVKSRNGADLVDKINNRSVVTCVVGLGYVGLPLAIELARSGLQTVGVDTDSYRPDALNAGKSYLKDIPAETFKHLLNSTLTAQSSYSDLPAIDVFIVAVPTPLNPEMIPDLRFLKDACARIARLLKPGQLVSIESTTYPGTTEDELLPILESSGLRAERDFFLAYSPERIDPGNKKFTLKNTPKIVGGLGPESLEAAVTYYSLFVDAVIPVSSTRTAEMIKIYENTYRLVNIALVNEMAMLCNAMNLNTWEILDAAFSKPFGILPFYPGPGVGGHCIPLDPHYLEWKARTMNIATEFIALSGRINRAMPSYVVNRVRALLSNKGIALGQAKILILGVAYKKDADEIREAPALKIIELLKTEGVEVSFHDSRIQDVPGDVHPLQCLPLTAAGIASCDLVLIANEDTTIDYEWVVKNAKAVFDTRNATRAVHAHRHKITLL